MVQVIHKLATSDDEASKYGFKSWIEYWKNYTGKYPGFKCPFCGKFPKPLVGAHVVKMKDLRTYIVPCCDNCNLNPPRNKYGLQLPQEIDENLLVPHPPT